MAVALPCTVMNAETWQSVSVQGSVSHGQTPLWLHANKHGLSALTQANGYAAYEVQTRKETGKVSLEAGAQLVLPLGYRYDGYAGHYTSHFVVQEAYARMLWRNLYVSAGAKERSMALKMNDLSTGSQTLGIGARPVPQVQVSMNDYWSVPGTNHWVALKMHMGFGVMTDGEWQARFAQGSGKKYNRMTRYHEKAGYLRIGPEERPLSVTAGLEMAAQWGGTLYNFSGSDQELVGHHDKIKLKSNLKSYLNALIGRNDGDVGESQFKNNEGNLLGSWVARIDWKQPEWQMGVYLDHYFEDHSAMFFLDYDGYGKGEAWNEKKEHRYLRYPMADFLLGMDLQLNEGRWLKAVCVEYLNTRYQSGPIYHDHNATWSDHIGGIDEYYNHATLSGWQHWGEVMGNALYLAPNQNSDGYIGTNGNRLRAWHIGIKGEPTEQVEYRCLLSYEKNWGTYKLPFAYPREDVSLLIEATAHLNGCHLTVSFGQDWGKLLGNNTGLQVTMKKDF